MRNPDIAEGIRQRYELLSASLSERQRRLWYASEAKAIGYGGVSLVSRCTGITRPTIHAGLKELFVDSPSPTIRHRGPAANHVRTFNPNCSQLWTAWCSQHRIVSGVSVALDDRLEQAYLPRFLQRFSGHVLP